MIHKNLQEEKLWPPEPELVPQKALGPFWGTLGTSMEGMEILKTSNSPN